MMLLMTELQARNLSTILRHPMKKTGNLVAQNPRKKIKAKRTRRIKPRKKRRRARTMMKMLRVANLKVHFINKLTSKDISAVV
jgi:hypothetical protein